MDPRQIILSTTEEILARAGFEAGCSWTEDLFPMIRIASSQPLTSLIGARGEHLYALEHIVRLLSARRMAEHAMPDFFLDVDDYRKSHIIKLFELADEAAQRVLAKGVSEALAPMSAHERKLLHTKLASYTSLQTESIGVEPNRRIIIKLASS
ncbi:MAG: R3H domain-containing nucleic acid-binding protein [Patescibacteria group bacterium]